MQQLTSYAPHIYRYVESQQDWESFCALWGPNWAKKRYEQEAFMGDAIRIIVSGPDGKDAACAEVIHYNPDTSSPERLAQTSTVEDLFAFRKLPEAAEHRGLIYEVDKLSVLPAYQNSKVVSDAVSAIGATLELLGCQSCFTILNVALLWKFRKLGFPVRKVGELNKVTPYRAVPCVINIAQMTATRDSLAWYTPEIMPPVSDLPLGSNDILTF